MIQNKKKELANVDLLFGAHFLPAVDLQFLQQKQDPLDKEQILPAPVADVVPADFLAEQGSDVLVGVATDETFLDQ
jgi:hypothetical protein